MKRIITVSILSMYFCGIGGNVRAVEKKQFSPQSREEVRAESDGNILTEAVKSGNSAGVRAFLRENGKSVNLQDEAGNTALMYAVKNGNLEITTILLQAGAKKDVANKAGETPDSAADLIAETSGDATIKDTIYRLEVTGFNIHKGIGGLGRDVGEIILERMLNDPKTEIGDIKTLALLNRSSSQIADPNSYGKNRQLAVELMKNRLNFGDREGARQVFADIFGTEFDLNEIKYPKMVEMYKRDNGPSSFSSMSSDWDESFEGSFELPSSPLPSGFYDYSLMLPPLPLGCGFVTSLKRAVQPEIFNGSERDHYIRNRRYYDDGFLPPFPSDFPVNICGELFNNSGIPAFMKKNISSKEDFMLSHSLGFNLFSENGSSDFALSEAIRGGHADVVKYLTEKGADINQSLGNGARYSDIALLIASQKGNTQMLEYLIKLGANVQAANTFGLQNQNPDALLPPPRPLYPYDFDQNEETAADNPPGKTALMYAVANKHKDAAKLLIMNGADVNAVLIDNRRNTDRMKKTALTYAVQNNDKESAELLLNYGADFKKVYEGGYTLLHMAALKNRPQTVNVLISHGIDPEAVTEESGNTALKTAEERHLRQIADYLRRHGGEK